MSDRWYGRAMRRTLVCVSLVMVGPCTVAAQSATDYRRELDRLIPEWRAAKAAVEESERARQHAARAIVIERGGLRITVDSAVVPHVMDALAAASREIDATFGAKARLLADHPVIIRRRTTVSGPDTTYSLGVRANTREDVVTLGDPVETRAQLIAALHGSLVVSPLHAVLDDSIRAWFRAALPAGDESRSELGVVYLELVTGSTTISRRCLAGDLVGCRQILGLSPIADPVLEGYTATQRRALVGADAPRFRTPGKAAEFDRCVAQHDDAACAARLRELSVESVLRSIASANIRRSFARSVLEQGGPGAYERLAATSALALDARFASAGGLPADSLVASWRARALSARPARSPVTPSTALATLAWIVACGALALRSSRWR